MTAKESLDPSSLAVAEGLSMLQEVVNDHAAPPLAHTICLAAGYLNDLSIKGKRKMCSKTLN